MLHGPFLFNLCLKNEITVWNKPSPCQTVVEVVVITYLWKEVHPQRALLAWGKPIYKKIREVFRSHGESHISLWLIKVSENKTSFVPIYKKRMLDCIITSYELTTIVWGCLQEYKQYPVDYTYNNMLIFVWLN